MAEVTNPNAAVVAGNGNGPTTYVYAVATGTITTAAAITSITTTYNGTIGLAKNSGVILSKIFISIVSKLKIKEDNGDEVEKAIKDKVSELSGGKGTLIKYTKICLLYTSPSPRDATLSRMPSSA